MSRGICMDIGTKLKARRKELDLTMLDVAKSVGVSEATVSRWESGDIANMRRDKIVSLAHALQVSPFFIMGWDEKNIASKTLDIGTTNISSPEDMERYNPIIHKIPILGQIAAGTPIYAEENIEDYTYTEYNGGADYFALRVKGDSMNALSIKDGSVIIVRQQPQVENGEIAVVRVNGDNATVKCFKQDGSPLSHRGQCRHYSPAKFCR